MCAGVIAARHEHGVLDFDRFERGQNVLRPLYAREIGPRSHENEIVIHYGRKEPAADASSAETGICAASMVLGSLKRTPEIRCKVQQNHFFSLVHIGYRRRSPRTAVSSSQGAPSLRAPSFFPREDDCRQTVSGAAFIRCLQCHACELLGDAHGPALATREVLCT